MSSYHSTPRPRKLGPLLFLISTVIAATAELLLTSPAQADCVYQGKTYRTGETAGPYICMPDGSMQPQ